MLHFFKEYKKIAIIFFIVSSFILFLFYETLKPSKRLPIYQPFDVDSSLVDSTIQHVKKYHKVKDFSLTNQNGDTITHSFYDNKIYVANFFFTTCPGICPVLTKNFNAIQEHFLNDEGVLLVSFSVTPETDTSEVLNKYAKKHDVIDNKWNLLTGKRKQIYDLARKSYLAVKEAPVDSDNDMIHTENFILVDQKKRIRGFYDGTKENAIKKLIEDIELLKNEGG